MGIIRVLVCGDRHWDDKAAIVMALSQHKPIDMLIFGDATGADTQALDAALFLNLPHLPPFEAEWDKYGRAAGPIRNQRMLDEGKPDLVLAFHRDLEHSRGTKDMVARARKAGILVKVVDGKH